MYPFQSRFHNLQYVETWSFPQKKIQETFPILNNQLLPQLNADLLNFGECLHTY